MKYLALLILGLFGLAAVAAILARGGEWRKALRSPDLFGVAPMMVRLRGSLRLGGFVLAWGNVAPAY